MRTLLHPFDDPVLATLMTARGYARDDVLADYDPTRIYCFEEMTGDEREPPARVQFLVGDDEYAGSLSIGLADEALYVRTGGFAELRLHGTIPLALAAGCRGRPLRDVAVIPGGGMYRIATACAHPVEPNRLSIVLEDLDAETTA